MRDHLFHSIKLYADEKKIFEKSVDNSEKAVILVENHKEINGEKSTDKKST